MLFEHEDSSLNMRTTQVQKAKRHNKDGIAGGGGRFGERLPLLQSKLMV